MKISEGVSVSVSGSTVTVSGPKASLSRGFNPAAVNVVVKQAEGEVELAQVGRPSRRKSAALNALAAHLRNMFKGVSSDFVKKLSIVYAHFPISIEVKGSQVVIKNFLGEKSPRGAKIVGSTQVKADKQEITVSGSDKEAVGQTAANIRQATRVRNRDVRVFQDGVYPA